MKEASPAEAEKESCCCTERKADSVCCPDGKMTVTVLGSGCKSCHALLENTQAAVKAMGKENDIQVEYVTDLEKIMQYGVMSIQALSQSILLSVRLYPTVFLYFPHLRLNAS